MRPVTLNAFITLAFFQSGQNLDQAARLGRRAATWRAVQDAPSGKIIPALHPDRVIGVKRVGAKGIGIENAQVARQFGALFSAHRGVWTNAL